MLWIIVLTLCYAVVQSGQYDAKHFLLYYYYGGMIYTAVKNYDRAQFFFEIVSTLVHIIV